MAGLVMIEQFAAPVDSIGGSPEEGGNVYISPAGGSEGYGVGATIGVKLAAPGSPRGWVGRRWFVILRGFWTLDDSASRNSGALRYSEQPILRHRRVPLWAS